MRSAEQDVLHSGVFLYFSYSCLVSTPFFSLLSEPCAVVYRAYPGCLFIMAEQQEAAPTFRLADHLEKMPAFSEEEWAEISEEIPKVEDPFLQKYLDGRAALIAEEKKQRTGECLSACVRCLAVAENRTLLKEGKERLKTMC